MAKRTKAERRAAALKGWRTRRKNQRTSNAAASRPPDRGRGKPVVTRIRRAAPAPAKSKGGKREKTSKRVSEIRAKARTRSKPTKARKQTPAQREAARRRTTEFKRRSEAAKKGWRTRKRKEKAAKGKAPAPKRKEENQEYVVSVDYKPGRKLARHWSFQVIYKPGATDNQILEFMESWSRKRENRQMWEWITNLLYDPKAEIVIALGPLTARHWTVRKR